MTPLRPPFWGIEQVWLFYLLATLALAVCGLGVWEKVTLWLSGRRAAGSASERRGLTGALADGLLGRRIWRGDPAAGLMHLMILWGFLGLLAGTTAVAVDHYLVSFLHGRLYLVFSAGLELCGLLLVIGLLWALVRRYLQMVPRLERRATDLLPPLWILAVAGSGFLVEAARLAATAPLWAGWSFAGAWLGGLFSGPQAAAQAFPFIWWLHALLSLGFIAWLPWSKLAHALAAPLSLYLQEQPLAALAGEADAESPGPALRHLLHPDACTRCGRCVEVCPSALAGEPFSPRDLVQQARRSFRLEHSPLFRLPWLANRRQALLEQMQQQDREQAWYCTTCRACLETCPVQAAPLELVRHTRSGLVEEGSTVPPQLIDTLERLYKYQNPWLAKKGQKAVWAEGLDLPDLAKKDRADWLYFVGCTTSLDTRAQGLASSLSAVLGAAGVSFGTLGKKEPCCGDIARRLGEQGLFEEQRDKTLALLQKKGLNRLVCSSPHCWDTFKKVYPQQWQDEAEAPAAFQPLHYSQLLARLLDEGKLRFEQELPLKATYHDPCYLARHNGVTGEPRRLLRAVPGLELVEMEAHGKDALCCGGGGGRMWQELPEQANLGQRRLEQAAATGAQVLVTACPLCLIMLEDARKTGGFEERLQIMDLSELAALALGLTADDESS
jgi:Fe-S oxidoreductase/nitrate reductase gamma subunit